MTSPLRILLVDGDTLLRQAVAEHLSAVGGFTVTEAASAADGLAAVDGHDLIVVDQGLPDLDGALLCREVRSRGLGTPLLLLAPAETARFDGSASVMAKPFRLGSLLAKVEDLLARRPCPAPTAIGPWMFDADRRQLSDASGTRVRLTDKEAAILCRLRQAGGVVARDVLLAEVFGYSAAITTHTLETHIYRLRRKLEPDSGTATLLLSEGGGYRLAP
jgi:DNA-binding response OmpR family regulator